MNKLTDTKIKKLKSTGTIRKLSDGLGLYLHISSIGTKTWIYRYQQQDQTKKTMRKEQVYTIGTYPIVSLADARAEHTILRSKVKKGVNIQQEKKLEQFKIENTKITFKTLAEEWFEIWSKGKATGTVKACKGYLNNYMYPLLKNISVGDIEYLFVKKYFLKLWNTKAESAKKSAQYLSKIMDYAVDNNLISTNPLIRLNKALPKQDVKHHPAILDPVEYGRFCYSMDHIPNLTGYAIRLLIHIAIREGAALEMKWSNVDWNKKQLEYYDTKRKADHIVPLSTQALQILKDVKKISGNKEYIFASNSKKGRLCAESLMKAIRLRGWGQNEVTIHGFRSSFETICEEEEIETNITIIEMATNHAMRGPLGDTYRRGAFLKQRRVLMQKWSDFIDVIKRNYIKKNILKPV